PNTIALNARRVLINGNHLAIGKQAQSFWSSRGQIVSREQGSGQQSPQTHMSAILVAAHSPISNLQHVRIIPVSSPSIFRKARLTEADLRHACVFVTDVAGRTPQISTHRSSPRPHGVVSVLAETKNNRTARLYQGCVHFAVGIY